MAKMGRPKSDNPLDKRVTVRMSQGEYDILLEYAQNHKMTMAQVMKMCVGKELSTKHQ